MCLIASASGWTLRTAIWQPGNETRLSCNRTCCCYIPKSHFSFVQNLLLFSPLITVQHWAKGETETLPMPRQASVISHTHNTAYFSPLHLRASETCRQMQPHAQTHKSWIHIFILHLSKCTCAHTDTSLPPVPTARQLWAPFHPLHNKRGCKIFSKPRFTLCNIDDSNIYLAEHMLLLHWNHLQYTRFSSLARIFLLWGLWNQKCLLTAAENYWFIIPKVLGFIDPKVKLCFPHLDLPM